MKAVPLIVPPELRIKYVSSKVSREIFFIDCLEDLRFCSRSTRSYDLIRASVILRVLLLNDGLQTIMSGYTTEVKFKTSSIIIEGEPLTGINIRNIKTLLPEDIQAKNPVQYLSLLQLPLEELSIEELRKKICLKIGSYCFSVKNIVELIANKHGAAHLESTFDTSSMHSFLWGDFSPFSMTEDNFFLKKIGEIALILTEALLPLSVEIIKNLNSYNRDNLQAKASSIATIMTFEEFKKHQLKNE